MTVDIAIVTFGREGIARVAGMIAYKRPDVNYVVSWQASDGIAMPEALMRDDVMVLRPEGVGLSANRNNALLHCRGDIVVFFDDDVRFFPERLDGLVEVYRTHPDAAVVTFCGHEPGKHYPLELTVLGVPMPRNYFASGFEISVRRRALGSLAFDTRLGLGSEYYGSGEDEMFVVQAIRRGLKCLYAPMGLCAHVHPSTGFKPNPSSGVIVASGILIACQYGLLQTAMRLPLKAWRMHRRQGVGLFRAFRLLVSGALMSRRFLAQGDV